MHLQCRSIKNRCRSNATNTNTNTNTNTSIKEYKRYRAA